MGKLKDALLSTTNAMILLVLAGENMIFALQNYFHEYSRMDCIDKAIYHNATENGFTSCILKSGIFDDPTSWIFSQFVLAIATIVIGIIIEGKRRHKK